MTAKEIKEMISSLPDDYELVSDTHPRVTRNLFLVIDGRNKQFRFSEVF